MQKASRNQLGNSKNTFQTNTKRVLTVCSAGLLRAPTAANVLHKAYGFNCRAAGIVEEYALIPVSEVLVFWADEFVFMNEENFNDFNHVFAKDNVAMTKIKLGAYQILGIPDNFSWNDETLRAHILTAYDEKKNLT